MVYGPMDINWPASEITERAVWAMINFELDKGPHEVTHTINNNVWVKNTYSCEE